MAEKTSTNKTLTVVLGLIGLAILIGVILAFSLPKTGASPAPAPTQVEVATEIATAEPTQTIIPPTATAEPTVTATSLPSPTAIPALAMIENGFSVWCYPDGQTTAPPSGVGQAIMPVGARASTVVDGVPEVAIPNYSCNYVFEFNQKAPEGLTVEIYDWLQKKPIFTLPLTPATDKPTAAVMYTKNAYLSKMVFWEYTYKFIVKDQSGTELWNNPVHLNVPWRPKICLAGVLSKATTLRCPLRQDSHPWDPWYGKTPVPNDDENPIP
ncbi:MAG: hypothetical protein WCG34_02610 [Leptolinea sp.]